MKIFDKNKDGRLDLNDLARYGSKILDNSSRRYMSQNEFHCLLPDTQNVRLFSYPVRMNETIHKIISKLVIQIISLYFPCFSHKDLSFRRKFPSPVPNGCKFLLYVALS